MMSCIVKYFAKENRLCQGKCLRHKLRLDQVLKNVIKKQSKYFVLLSDHASLLAWSMVNQIVIKYCLVSYFKGACRGNGVRVCYISQKDFHTLYQGRDYGENGKQAEIGHNI